jgi:hypothetical protein
VCVSVCVRASQWLVLQMNGFPAILFSWKVSPVFPPRVRHETRERFFVFLLVDPGERGRGTGALHLLQPHHHPPQHTPARGRSTLRKGGHCSDRERAQAKERCPSLTTAPTRATSFFLMSFHPFCLCFGNGHAGPPRDAPATRARTGADAHGERGGAVRPARAHQVPSSLISTAALSAAWRGPPRESRAAGQGARWARPTTTTTTPSHTRTARRHPRGKISQEKKSTRTHAHT